jgi:hypothetical protein
MAEGIVAVTDLAHEILVEASHLDQDKFRQMQNLSDMALKTLREAGSETTDSNLFTLAMHGFTNRATLDHRGTELSLKYRQLQRRFTQADQPLAIFLDPYYYPNDLKLGAIGVIAYDTKLVYKVGGDDHRVSGAINMPLKNFHTWRASNKNEPVIESDGSISIAYVVRNAGNNVAGIGAEAAFQVRDDLFVGWNEVMAQHNYTDETNSHQARRDQAFLERIMLARTAFSESSISE